MGVRGASYTRLRRPTLSSPADGLLRWGEEIQPVVDERPQLVQQVNVSGVS